MLTDRNIEILKIIVEEYLQTGEVLGSKLLLKKYDLWVSSATVRNDMAKLEELELVFQPYHSAGRLPTTKGIRAFVDFLMQKTPDYFLEAENSIKNISNFYELATKVCYDLAEKTGEISFFIMPDTGLVEYSGTGTFLEQNHKRLGDSIFSIIKMLEDKKSFQHFIKSYPIAPWINTIIGEENTVSFLQDYTIILKKVRFWEKEIFLWVIWSLKMNYSFNISAVNGIL